MKRCQKHKRRTVKESDVYECVHDTEVLDWLKPDFESMPVQETKLPKNSKVVDVPADPNAPQITAFFSGGENPS